MKKLALIVAALAVSTAQADCYNRTAITAQTRSEVSRVTDVRQQILPDPAGFACRVTFRALIGQDWHTGEGSATGFTGDDPAQICAQAQTVGRSFLLAKIGTTTVNQDSDVVCTDQPLPEVRPVKIGQIIGESEVQIHTKYPKPFSYQGTQCRWYMEYGTRSQDITPWQGVICRVQGDRWKVVDKF